MTKQMMDITPTPEWMEAVGRAYDKYGAEIEGYPTGDHQREQFALMVQKNDSMLKDISDTDEKHRAVGAMATVLRTTGQGRSRRLRRVALLRIKRERQRSSRPQ